MTNSDHIEQIDTDAKGTPDQGCCGSTEPGPPLVGSVATATQDGFANTQVLVFGQRVYLTQLGFNATGGFTEARTQPMDAREAERLGDVLEAAAYRARAAKGQDQK